MTGDDMGIHQEQDLEPLEHRMKDRHGVATPDTAWENEDETDPTSHSALSKRAEEILANAKKRLTVSVLSSFLKPLVSDTCHRRWKAISIARVIPSATPSHRQYIQ